MPAEFSVSDLFENVSGKFDMIVSNPPYISSKDINDLMPEVRDFEPAGALDGGENGLDFYERIAKEAPSYLKDGGRIILEVGYNQAEAVKRLLLENGFTNIEITKDLAGIDRVVCGVFGDTDDE